MTTHGIGYDTHFYAPESVCLCVCLQKFLHWPYLLILKTLGLHISLEHTLLQDLSVNTKFKVIIQGQVKYQGHSFQKNGLCGGITVSQICILKLC